MPRPLHLTAARRSSRSPAMPELPEVETVRRMLESAVAGRRIASASVSRKRLRTASLAGLPAKLKRRTFAKPRRTGKFLLLDLDAGVTLLSHLGMSGRWLFWPKQRKTRCRDEARASQAHVRGWRDALVPGHAPLRHAACVETGRLERDASLKLLGPDPLAVPRDGEALRQAARGARAAIKVWLLDQRRIAGLGNIYVSEVLFRANVDLGAARVRCVRKSGPHRARDRERARGEHRAHGTTFSTYRTLWNEPGEYGRAVARV